MTKRYREAVDVVIGKTPSEPTSFTWRDGRYQVLTVLGHWREDAGYWAGGGVDVPQRDLWRVEAHRGQHAATASRGIYELVCEEAADQGLAWRLDRVWD